MTVLIFSHLGFLKFIEGFFPIYDYPSKLAFLVCDTLTSHVSGLLTNRSSLVVTQFYNVWLLYYERMTTHHTSGISSFFQFHFSSTVSALLWRLRISRDYAFHLDLEFFISKPLVQWETPRSYCIFLITLKARQRVDTVSSHPQNPSCNCVTDFYPIL